MNGTEKKLEDFGEHIAGAKKETYFRAIDLSQEETKSLPLSKLWADKDIKAIEDKNVRAIAFSLKDNLSNKPRNAAKLNRWLNTVKDYQNTVVDLITKNDPDYTNTVLQNLQNTKTGNKAYLLTKLNDNDWKKIENIEFYQTYQANNITLAVKIGGKRHEFSPKQAVSLQDYNPQSVIDEFADDIQAIISKQAQEQSATKGMTAKSFDIFQRRDDKTTFISAKTDRQHTPLIKFDTLAEAREYLKDPDNITELNDRWTTHREYNAIGKADMRNAVNEERIGQSYRDYDITPDEFMDTFGVRGGQFGNWVNSDERQQMLNASYDGFMDLSKALNINPKAIGLNGTLGIAFGARGSGLASAHYEASEQVINLTKTRGAGSFAHEWWHALDHYMKNGDDLLTRQLTLNSTARHQELISPMHELLKDIHKSGLYSRSKTADAYRSGAYFSTDVEMTARAFEAYVQHDLSKKGIKNDFLVNIRAEQNWQKNTDAYPYLKADELEQLSKAYSNVFDILKDVDKEFIATEYEPEATIHADTLAVDETKENKEAIQQIDVIKSQGAKADITERLETHLISHYTQEKIDYDHLKQSAGSNERAEQLISAMARPLNQSEQANGNGREIPSGGSQESHAQQGRSSSPASQEFSEVIENNRSTENEKQSPNHQLRQSELHQTSAIDTAGVGGTGHLQQTGGTVLSSLPPSQETSQRTIPTPNVSTQNTYIDCPYPEKNEAKALGAKWDNPNRSWYVPAGLDLNQFKKWLPQEQQTEKPTEQTSRSDTKNRVYLYTQPSDNPAIQELKAQGIVKFDLQHKLWFAHKDNQDAVRQWTTRPHVPTPEQALAEHLHSMGIVVATGHPVFDEKPHRLANEGSSDKNVMYHAYSNQGGVPYARITNFSRHGVSEWTYPAKHLQALKNIEAVDRANGGQAPIQQNPYTPKTPTATQTESKNHQSPQKDPEKIALENKMAQRAKMLMSFAPIADTSQNYLAKKQVSANNVARIVPDSRSIPEHLQAHIAIGNTPKQYFYLLANNPENKLVMQRGNLVIPQTNIQGEIRAFETIAYNGRKYALKDAEKKSTMTTLGSLEDGKPIIIAEGYATGATLHENTGQTVVVAFGKNGLLDIAKELRNQYPNSRVYIGADNDHNKEVNAGLIDAAAVQKAVQNVHILVPQFEKGDTGKDWNDVLVDKGVDELKRQIKEQLAAINPQHIDKVQSQGQAKPVHEPVQKNPLDPDVIRQNYPTMSEENIQTVQMWRAYLPLKYADEPSKAEFALTRLENKLLDYANGEILTPPKPHQAELSSSVEQTQTQVYDKNKER